MKRDNLLGNVDDFLGQRCASNLPMISVADTRGLKGWRDKNLRRNEQEGLALKNETDEPVDGQREKQHETIVWIHAKTNECST